MMSKPLRLVLPEDVTETVRARIASGAYHDALQVVRDGLLALAEREETTEAWLRATVIRDGEALRRGTLETIDLEDIREEIEQERRATP